MPAADLWLTSADGGRTVHVDGPYGDLEVALEANPSTGFRWIPALADTAVVAFAGERFDEAPEGIVGRFTPPAEPAQE